MSIARQIKITKAGYLYIDGKKVSERKIDPFYTAPQLKLTAAERKIITDWVAKNYQMVNG